MKKCIICHEEFTEAPPEHVIPKSIGGQYTIHSVCETCNASMNKNIDEVFKNHKIIAHYRFAFDIKGRGKNVPDPLRNEKINIDGEDYKMKLTDDLKIETRLPPKLPNIKDLKLNESFTATLDGKDMDLLDEYLEKAAKHLNIPKENITIKSKVVKHREESQAYIPDANNKLLLEFSKILYQTACDLLDDDFVDDTIARKYATMLKNGEIDKSLKHEINPENRISNEVFLHTVPNLYEMHHTHAIILTGYYGVGLVGLVKIFNSYHVQILSRSEKFSKVGMKIILNDFKKNTLGVYTPNKLPKCSVNIHNDGVTNYGAVGLELQDNPVDKNYPVRLADGRIVADSLFSLVDDTRLTRQIKTDFTSTMDVTIQFDNSIFIKSKSLNKLLPIESVIYHFTIETLKKR